MNNASHAGLSHPLVAAYLDDLDQALASADAQERLDTVTSVREHLSEALDGQAKPTTEQVQAVLEDLGSAEKIAASATPASAAESPASDAAEPRRGDWVPPALLAVSIVSLVIPFFGGLLALGTLVAAIVLLKRETRRRGLLKATIAVSVVTLVITAFLATATLAWSTFTVTGDSTSGVTVSSEPAVEAPVSP